MHILFISSLFLEGILSNFVPINSSFSLLLLFTSIIIFYPYVYNIKKYIVVVFLYGILYDFIYTQTLFLDGVLFSVCIIILHYIHRYFKTMPLSFFLLLILMVILYRSFGYFILCMTSYMSFNLDIYINSILSSIISNVIYGTFLYYLLRCLHNKKILKKLI